VNADFQARLLALPPGQRAAFERLLAARQRRDHAGGSDHPAGDGAEARCPLSSQQERIWLLSQLGGDEQFILRHRLEICGPLDAAGLAYSIDTVLARHTGLSAAVMTDDTGPYQQASKVGPPTVVHDGAAHDRFLELDASGGALWRHRLVRNSANSHTLYFTAHHIVWDGWSVSIFAHELRECYTAWLAGQPPQLSELQYSYFDYATWQRSRGESEALSAGVAFWSEQLRSLPTPSALPGRRSEPSGNGACVDFTLDQVTVQALRAQCAEQRATVIMGLLTSLALVLTRYSGVGTTVIGTPFSNRGVGGSDRLIGCFLNMLPLRMDISAADTWLMLLRRSREICLSAMEHGSLPFDRIVRCADTPRILGRHPLFDVMLVGQEDGQAAFSLPGVTVSSHVATPGPGATDLTVSVAETAEVISVRIHFDDGLFGKSAIERLAGHWQTMLGEAIAHPHLSCAYLRLLGREEQAGLVQAGDLTRHHFADSRSMMEMFLDQVARAPGATALISPEGAEVSYRELSAWSMAVASELLARGAGAEAVVGIAIPLSVEFVVTVLATWHCGAVFLALDPVEAEERLRFMVTESRASIVVARGPDVARLKSLVTGGAKTMGLPSKLTAAASSPASAAPTPGSAAYAIFTSGSTGRPKAVIGTHSATLNRLRWQWDTYPPQPDDVYCMKSPPVFVDSIAEMLSGLLAGRPTAVVSGRTAAAPAALADVLERAGVTRLVVVPALLRALLNLSAASAKLRRLRLVTVSGEALDRMTVEAFARVLPEAKLLNLYGSSEVAADVTAWQAADGPGAPPIGRPISGVSVRVVDARMNLVPVGVTGELCVGGAALARGYAGQPGLSASHFVPDPFGPPGARMYRTGDLAYWIEPGLLGYAGRSDAQLKIRGVRVEPAEVEAVLDAHPAVRESGVTAQRYADQDNRLVAYLVPEPAAPFDHAALQSFARERLPRAMVPTIIVVAQTLPHTPSGKIDRQALRALAVPPRAPGTGPGRPMTELERAVATVWRAALGASEIGPQDDFFESGGHSLLLAQIAARLSSVLAADVPVELVFNHPVLEDQCRAIEAWLRAGPVRVPADADLRATVRLRPITPCPSSRQTARRLDDSILAGAAEQLDAAAITYLPARWKRSGLISDAVWQEEFKEPGALLAQVFETPVGRIGQLVTPLGAAELYDDPSVTAAIVDAGIRRAAELGAGTVTLTGLLASATSYGRAVQHSVAGVRVTTGHAVTSAAVVLNTLSILRRLGRDIGAEEVCVLGMGSIGTASARLLVDIGCHPRRLVLCDLFERYDELTAYADSFRGAGFAKDIVVAPARGKVPADVYRSSVVIGAVNVEKVLDVAKLHAGTVVVDDSFPPSVDLGLALERMNREADVAIIEAGLLAAPADIDERRYLPDWLRPLVGPQDSCRMPAELMGCVLASGLLYAQPELSATIGKVDPAVAVRHLERLTELGFTAAVPQASGRQLSDGLLDALAAGTVSPSQLS
jgi:amino acid adenylation domain-containing protein